MYPCNPSTLEVEARGSKARGVLRYIGSSSQLGVLDTLSKKLSIKVWLSTRKGTCISNSLFLKDETVYFVSFSYWCFIAIINIRGKTNVGDAEKQRCQLEEVCPASHPSAPPPQLLRGAHLRISQEKVGPDFIDVGQCGGPTDPQQSLQRGQRGWLVGGHLDRSMNLWPPKVLLLQ